MRNELRQSLGGDSTLGRENADLFGDILELAHIARPLVVHEQLLGALVEHHAVHLIFLGHLQSKQSEQQYYILATLAKRGHLDGNRVETIVEVFAEATLTDGLTDIYVCSGYDAYVGLTHLGSSHGDILSRFEHTQQSGLSGQWQLANLIEEQCALVGHTKVSWRIVDSTSIRALYMTKELAIDGTLGDRAAVDGEILLTATRRVVVDYTRDDLLTHSTLAHNEHTEIGGRNLKGYVEHVVQSIAIAYDIVPLFYVLKF